MPEDKAQRNFTDAESRIMPAPGGPDFLQGYNCQTVVDSAHQVIVAARATNQASDKQQAVVMMEETISNTDVVCRYSGSSGQCYSQTSGHSEHPWFDFVSVCGGLVNHPLCLQQGPVRGQPFPVAGALDDYLVAGVGQPVSFPFRVCPLRPFHQHQTHHLSILVNRSSGRR